MRFVNNKNNEVVKGQWEKIMPKNAEFFIWRCNT
jgi:hypothetical protein